MDTRHPNIRSSHWARLSTSVLALLLLPTVAVSQVHTEDQSHRILPPDAARLSQLKAQAALLYRLQQFSGKDLPGVSDPARKKRLQKIMQQMAMKLGQSSLDMGGRTNPGRSRTRPGRQPGQGPGLRPRSSQPDSAGGNTPTGDLRSFLEQISGRSLDDLPDFSEPPRANPGQPSTFSGNRTGYTRNPLLPDNTSQWLSRPNEQRPPGSSPFDDASDSSLTLTERLTRLADRARVDSLGGSNSSLGGSGNSGSGGRSWLSNAGLQSALAKAMEGTANSIARHATLSQETEQGRLDPQPRQRGSEDEGPGATAWISDLASRATAASESAHESMASSSTLSQSDRASFGSTGFLLPLLLIAGTGAAVWWLQRRCPKPETDLAFQAAARMPKTIRNREDIVTAFHVITARAPEVTATWWTHRRAAIALAKADPKSQAAVKTLAALYEQARYLPRDAALTPEQLSEASQAVKRIRRS